MAPNKKGLSLEEKRKKMMELFYESKDVFLLKDLEKLAPKLKGSCKIVRAKFYFSFTI